MEIPISGGKQTEITGSGRFYNAEGKKMELNLDEQLELLSVFNSSPNLIILLDSNGRVIRLNRAVLEVINPRDSEVKPDEHLQRIVRCVISATKEEGCGRGSECRSCNLRAMIREALDKRQALSNIEIADYSEHAIYYVSVTPVEFQEHHHVLVTIDHHPRIELSVKTRSQIRWNEHPVIVEHSREIFFKETQEGKILDISPSVESILGVRKPDILGRSLGDFASDSNRWKKYRTAIKEVGEVRDFEIELTPPGKEKLTFSINARSIRGDSDDREVIVGIIRDISERKRLEEKLMHIQRLESIGNLVSGISHDFNNILSTIMGFSELILSTTNLDPELRELVEEIYHAGERATNLTKKLLIFSRHEGSEREYFQPDRVIKGLRKMIDRLFPENIQVHYNLQAPDAVIFSDVFQFEQVLLNLTINARDAMPDGGVLEIKTEVVSEYDSPEKKNYHLMVKDNGVGISPGNLNRIFDPYFTTKGKGKGTGLGLYIVRNIIERNEGRIAVESREGEGTVFHIYFPASLIQKQTTDSQEIEVKPAIGKGKGAILVVEDNIEIRALIKRALQKSGYRVIQASSAEKALRILQQIDTQIDLLISDLILPDLNGKRLYELLQKNNPEMKVLFISGYGLDYLEKHLDGLPAENIIQKPFSLANLLSKVKEKLESHSDKKRIEDGAIS